MKLVKQLKVLRGITGIRIKIGLTQLALARYLGVSKSTISMVENDKRRLPEDALMRITRLEIDYFAHQQQSTDLAFSLPVYQESSTEIVIRQQKEKLHRTTLTELRSKLRLVEASYRETLEQLANLEKVLVYVAGQTTDLGSSGLLETKQKLLKKLKRSDLQSQAKLQGRIAMMEIIIAAETPAEQQQMVNEENHSNEVNDSIRNISAPPLQKDRKAYDFHLVNRFLEKVEQDSTVLLRQIKKEPALLLPMRFERRNSIPLLHVNYS